MSEEQIAPGLYALRLSFVNAFLIDSDELTLIDTGWAKDVEKIMESVRAIGRRPTDIRHILVTHCHPDHAGGLAAVKQLTGAPAYMHPIDAAAVRTGIVPVPQRAGPSLFNKIMFYLFMRSSETEIEPAEVEHEIQNGDELPIDAGIQAIHVPGHCAGQLAFLWNARNHDVMFTADAAVNMMGIGYPPGLNDLEVSRLSLQKLAALDFDMACFGHGKEIMKDAATKFRQKWGAPQRNIPVQEAR